MERVNVFFRMFLIFPLCTWHNVCGKDIIQNYFTDVFLSCNGSQSVNASANNNAKTLVSQVWLLPDGSVIKHGKTPFDRVNVEITNEGGSSVLHLRKIDDMNFGVYWCIQVYNDLSVDAVRHTLNIDGPPLGDFYEQQRKNAIVGAISGGVVLSIIILVYVVWYFRCSEKVRRKRRLAEDLSKGINRYSTQIYDTVGMELYMKKTDIKVK